MFELQSTSTVKQIVRDEYHHVMYEKYGEKYVEYNQLGKSTCRKIQA